MGTPSRLFLCLQPHGLPIRLAVPVNLPVDKVKPDLLEITFAAFKRYCQARPEQVKEMYEVTRKRRGQSEQSVTPDPD
jgi:hypothetical protein